MLLTMNRSSLLFFSSVAALAALAGTANATPLRLDYSVNQLGTLQYHYDFTLTVDNHDGSFAAGQGWGWLMFGDQQNAPTNLGAYVMDSTVYPVGPWTSLGTSQGFHNGPTLLPLVDVNTNFVNWFPAGVGSQLHWAGTANVSLPDGTLLFSTLNPVNRAVAADFEPAHLVSTPEPASMAALALGALAMLRRRRANR